MREVCQVSFVADTWINECICVFSESSILDVSLDVSVSLFY